jgi:hypothetical protein
MITPRAIQNSAVGMALASIERDGDLLLANTWPERQRGIFGYFGLAGNSSAGQ